MFIVKFLDDDAVFDVCSKDKELLADEFIGNYGGIYGLENDYFYEKDTGIQVAKIIELYELK